MGYQTSPSMTKDYSFFNMYVFKFHSSGGQVMKWDASDVFVWHPEIFAKKKSQLWSFLSQTSNISQGSPNQVKHIDLFSFRKKKKKWKWEIGKEHILVSHFLNISATSPLFFSVQSQTVIKHSQSHWMFLLFTLPKRIFFKVKVQNAVKHPPPPDFL